MKRSEIILRARSAIGHGIPYKLGKGGYNPTALVPGRIGCDCSGFIAWVFGVSRKLDIPYYKNLNGGWFETSAIVADSKSTNGFVDQIDFIIAKPGDILVWPDGEGHQGHIGVISEVNESLQVPQKVIHCSLGNYRKYNDAIQETGIEIFLSHHAIAAKFAWVEGE